MRAVHAAAAAALVFVAVVALPRGTAQAECRGKIPPESIDTPHLDRQLLIGVRWELTVFGNPTRTLSLAFRLPRLIEVPGHGQIGLASLTPEERAGLRPATYAVTLRFNRPGGATCSIVMSERNAAPMGETEDSWGWDVPAGMTWEEFMEGSICTVEEKKALLKADCPNPRVWVQPDFTLHGIDAIKQRLDKQKAAEGVLQDAKLHVSLGRHGQAIALLERALGEHPGDQALREALEDARDPLERIFAEGQAAEGHGNLSYASARYAEGLRLSRGSSEYVQLFETAKARVDRAIDSQTQQNNGGGSGDGGGGGDGGSGGSGGDDDDDDSGGNGPITGPDILDPVYQKQVMDAQFRAASEQLAYGIARSSGAEKVGLAIGLGGPLLALGIEALASSTTMGTYMQVTNGVMTLIPAAVFPVLGNRNYRKKRAERLETEYKEARGRCDAGELVLCSEALRLSTGLVEITRRGDQRSDATVVWGLGRRRGPRFAYYWMLGAALGPYDDGTVQDDSVPGMAMRLVGRTGPARFGFALDDRSLDAADAHLAVFGAFVGAQLGTGLLSPHLDLQIAGAVHGKFDEPDVGGLDLGLVLGNTFHSHGLFSSRGPIHAGFAIDVSRTIPIDSVLGGGWVITAGLSGVVLPKVVFDRERFAPPTEPALPSGPPPTSYRETFVYAYPGSVGVELFRWNGGDGNWIERLRKKGNDEGDPRKVVFGILDGNLRLDGRGGGGSLAWAGYRARLGGGFELGWRFGLGGEYAPSEGDRPAVVSALPWRVYARYRLGRFAIEGGGQLSAFWVEGESDGSPNSYNFRHIPARVFVGLGIGH